MRRLRGTVAVKCPSVEAQARIERFFAERRGVDGKMRIAVHVALERKPIDGFALDHEVCLEACTSRDDRNGNDLISVSWQAEGDVPLPPFAGTIVTWAEGNPEVTFIELDGTYVAPLGMLGETFDEALGRMIAQRTAKDLLAQIVVAIGDTAMA